jgi:type I restriction enzyme M protein
MPSNIFASTGTNVSVLFMDRQADNKHIVLVDASKLGETIKDGKNQRTVLTPQEEQRIIDGMNKKKAEDDFSVVITADDIRKKNYSFSAGQYFEVKIEYVDISAKHFEEKMDTYQSNLKEYFTEGAELEQKILEQLKSLRYD